GGSDTGTWIARWIAAEITKPTRRGCSDRKRVTICVSLDQRMAQKPQTDPETRELAPRERDVIEAARRKAFILYEGVKVPHRSCGIALAETFNRPTRPYQALRRGGITGLGFCGSIRAGEHVLGELLGDPDPGGGVTPVLRAAVEWYQKQFPRRIN